MTDDRGGQSFYDQVGGHETFAALIHEFYRRVAGDPELRALYPEEDLGPAEHRLLIFMEQYWGGPRTYQAERGHPRLRMRHLPYAVTPSQRDRWLRHMFAAVDTINLPEAHDAVLRDYLVRAANMLVNAEEPS
ncbi:globin [Kribbia dieselivorans]|uniref:globin n=1 Tax=Kribbia dieselivorans TaxID=331526 RepID=UPI00083838EE|nr:globin [Kribbia dieselivorans]